MFASVIIAAFAENRAEWFGNNKDDFNKDFDVDAKGSKPGELDDEIPF
jgi:hypothetical protein